MLGHSGPASTLGSVHTVYWVSSGINTMKHYLKACIICIRCNAKPMAQLLGDLPLGQVAVHEAAFTNKGIEFDPFLVSTTQ